MRIFTLGCVVKTKKHHPCGSCTWEIVRTGADYKLKCCGCGRIILLTPDEANKRISEIVSEAEK